MTVGYSWFREVKRPNGFFPRVDGRWELGKTMEESGVRESYKEAGVLGG
jgi:hypothetical protein